MAGSITVYIEVTDPVRYEDYKRLAAAAVAAHGAAGVKRRRVQTPPRCTPEQPPRMIEWTMHTGEWTVHMRE